MKKKFLITTSIIALFYSVNINAQSEFNETDIDSYISQRSVEVYLEADFTGTPYKDKMFKNGTILKNGVPLAKNIGLRYNASKDLFEVKKSSVLKDDQAKVLKSSSDLFIIIDNENYVFLAPNENNSTQGYFLIDYKSDKTSLFKKIKKEYIPEQKAYTSLASNIAENYKEKLSLYLYTNDGLLIELPGSKSKRLKAFGDKSKDIKLFVKENKINLNKETGLIEVIKYYDTL
jgi:hypothetical protein